LRKTCKYSRSIEFSTLKLLKFTNIVCTVGQNICKLKLHGVDYITITKLIVVHINIAHENLDHISGSLPRILWMSESLSP
jgi:hypothetical protein